VSEGSQTAAAPFLAAPLARLDSSSESIVSAASTVVRAAPSGGGGFDEISATASIDSGVVMTSPLIWPHVAALESAANVIGGRIKEPSLQTGETFSSTLALIAEDSYTVEGCGAGGPLAASLAESAAKALASLNENLSCLKEVTHIPDANCTVQVRRIIFFLHKSFVQTVPLKMTCIN